MFKRKGETRMAALPDLKNRLVIDQDLALLYAGFRDAVPEEWKKKAEELCAELVSCLSVQVCWKKANLEKTEEGILLKGTGLVLPGSLAAGMLEDCDEAVLMAGTLGFGFERKLHALALSRPQDALLFDALGSSAIESVMNLLEEEIRKSEGMKDKYLTDRFSCGYGDLPLSLQKPLAEELALTRTCGIYLSGSLMMNPTKSITAIAGISAHPQPARIRGCSYCSMKENCERRKGGKPCGVS